jgi:hypothetical protein
MGRRASGTDEARRAGVRGEEGVDFPVPSGPPLGMWASLLPSPGLGQLSEAMGTQAWVCDWG